MPYRSSSPFAATTALCSFALISLMLVGAEAKAQTTTSSATPAPTTPPAPMPDPWTKPLGDANDTLKKSLDFDSEKGRDYTRNKVNADNVPNNLNRKFSNPAELEAVLASLNAAPLSPYAALTDLGEARIDYAAQKQALVDAKGALTAAKPTSEPATDEQKEEQKQVNALLVANTGGFDTKMAALANRIAAIDASIKAIKNAVPVFCANTEKLVTDAKKASEANTQKTATEQTGFADVKSLLNEGLTAATTTRSAVAAAKKVVALFPEPDLQKLSDDAFTTTASEAISKITTADNAAEAVRTNANAKAVERIGLVQKLSEATVAELRALSDRVRRDINANADAAQTKLATAGQIDDYLSGLNKRTDLDDIVKAAINPERRTELSFAAQRVREALAGGIGDFVTDQISLYYFSDVKRLMQVLNPSAKAVNADDSARRRKEADAARTRLEDGDGERVAAQDQVAALQTRVRTLREDMRIARAKTAELNASLARLTRVREQKKRDSDKANAGTDQAAKDRTAESLRVATEAETDGQTERDKSQKNLDDLQNESNDLPTRITAAETELANQQAEVDRQRKQTLRLAQDDVAAFAAARDDAEFLQADADGSSDDPPKRVLLYAFADSKTIFMRGKPEDVAATKEIIAKFDQPVPQARLTLWTQELDGKADDLGFRRFNDALGHIDILLSNTRGRVAGSVALLRDALHDVLGSDELAPRSSDTGYEARLRFFSAEFGSIKPLLEAAGFALPDPSRTTTLGEMLLTLAMAKRTYARDVFTFFEDSLQDQSMFGGKDGSKDGSKAAPLEFPKRGKVFYRSAKDKEYPSPLDNGALGVGSRWFPTLKRALNITSSKNTAWNSSTHDDVPTTAQQEIKDALERKAVARLSDSLDAVRLDIIGAHRFWRKTVAAQQNQENSTSAVSARKHALNTAAEGLLAAWNRFRIAGFKTSASDDAQSVDDVRTFVNADKNADKNPEEQPQFRDFAGIALRIAQNLENLVAAQNNIEAVQAGVSQGTTLLGTTSPNPASEQAEAALQEVENDFLRLRNAVRAAYPTDETNARIAAADQMLKELLIAVEDDLERHFIAPALYDLRNQIQGLTVGVLNRTEILASNRLSARVDPRASAQLDPGKTDNALEMAKQLAQVYAVAQTGGVAGTLGLLDTFKRDDPPGLYGITTGQLFQVTPVIDPSGQALRFRFDYVQNNRIKEPDGSVEPALPRIERHSVNTEVQLSSLELRNISRFDTNTQIGLPVRRDGGLPFFKEIPGIRDVPLVGYFTRRRGRSASISHSLIFAQTTVYPTIGDLIPLLASRGTGSIGGGGRIFVFAPSSNGYVADTGTPTTEGENNYLNTYEAYRLVPSPDGSVFSLLLGGKDANLMPEAGKTTASRRYQITVPITLKATDRDLVGFTTDCRYGAIFAGDSDEITLTLTDAGGKLHIKKLTRANSRGSSDGFWRVPVTLAAPVQGGDQNYTFTLKVDIANGTPQKTLFSLDSLDVSLDTQRTAPRKGKAGK